MLLVFFISWRFFVRHFAASSEIRTFVPPWKIVWKNSKRSKSHEEYRRYHIKQHSSGETAKVKKNIRCFCSLVNMLRFSCDIFKTINFFQRRSKVAWEYSLKQTDHPSSGDSAQMKKVWNQNLPASCSIVLGGYVFSSKRLFWTKRYCFLGKSEILRKKFK